MDNISKEPMKRVTLVEAKTGATVSVWPVDVAGWKKLGWFPEGEKAPEAIGVDMLDMKKEDLKALVEKENLAVAFTAKDTVADMVNKILVARELATK